MNATKRCPLCGATCFEDMDTCYCCMHRFEDASLKFETCYDQLAGMVEDDDEFGEGEMCDDGYLGEGEGAGAEGEPEGVLRSGEAPCFAFGPTIEMLSDVGDCIRIDIPLRALSSVIAATRAYTARQELTELPPAA